MKAKQTDELLTWILDQVDTGLKASYDGKATAFVLAENILRHYLREIGLRVKEAQKDTTIDVSVMFNASEFQLTFNEVKRRLAAEIEKLKSSNHERACSAPRGPRGPRGSHYRARREQAETGFKWDSSPIYPIGDIRQARIDALRRAAESRIFNNDGLKETRACPDCLNGFTGNLTGGYLHEVAENHSACSLCKFIFHDDNSRCHGIFI